jgi:hypothetical protein
MEKYYNEVDRDWKEVQRKIDRWENVPDSTLLYDEVVKAFEQLQRKGKMTPLIRAEYIKRVNPENNVYVQPVPELKYQVTEDINDKQSELLQLTLRLIPASYHPQIMSYLSVSLAVLTCFTSINVEVFLQWCTTNVCPCCLERLYLMWTKMFVDDIARITNDIKTLIKPMCSKQVAYYTKLINGLPISGRIVTLIKTRVVLYNELLFLTLKIKQSS